MGALTPAQHVAFVRNLIWPLVLDAGDQVRYAGGLSRRELMISVFEVETQTEQLVSGGSLRKDAISIYESMHRLAQIISSKYESHWADGEFAAEWESLRRAAIEYLFVTQEVGH